MVRKGTLFIFFTLCFFYSAFADAVKITAQAKTTVVVGERFNITYTVNAQGTRFRGPQINAFSVLSGPNQSSNSSVQIINGQVTQNVSYTFTYIVQAIKEGSFTIPAAVINVNGTDYQSNTLTINVVAGSTQQQQQQQQQKNQQAASGNDIFIKAFVDKTNPMQGEQIIVTYKIYTSVPVSQYTIDKLASFNGFWSEKLNKDSDKPKQTNEVVNGVNYTVAEIYKIALFSQRSGVLKIEPLGVKCVVQKRSQKQRQSVFDDFFNPFFDNVQNVEVNLKSNVLSINVSPLPSQNRTSDFNGIVGSFTLTSEIDQTKLKVNDAANLKIKISGKGNLKMIEEPKINFPPNLETYTPKVTDNITVSGTGVSGTRTFEYLIIPRSGGDYKINPIVFSFFNPTTKKYESLSTKEFILNVDKGVGGNSGNAVNVVSREDVKYIGSDIRFIKSNIFPLNAVDYCFFFSNMYLILILLPVLLFVLFIIIWRRQIKLNNNTALIKNKKANKIARNKLKIASKYMKDNKHELFYDEVSKAMWGYLNYKFNIPFADLSKETVKTTFENKNISSELAVLFINVLDECEFARFAPGDKTHTMDRIYGEAVDVIIKIEKTLK